MGDNTLTNQFIPKNIEGLLNIKQVLAGSFHSTVLLNDGTLKSWGQNTFGQTGNGMPWNEYPRIINVN
ncbi:Regulator of chromosome condensation (RCC1) repeat protein [compost metagenome]